MNRRAIQQGALAVLTSRTRDRHRGVVLLFVLGFALACDAGVFCGGSILSVLQATRQDASCAPTCAGARRKVGLDPALQVAFRGGRHRFWSLARPPRRRDIFRRMCAPAAREASALVACLRLLAGLIFSRPGGASSPWRRGAIWWQVEPEFPRRPPPPVGDRRKSLTTSATRRQARTVRDLCGDPVATMRLAGLKMQSLGINAVLYPLVLVAVSIVASTSATSSSSARRRHINERLYR